MTDKKKPVGSDSLDELVGCEDRAKLKLFIVWLQHRDVYLHKVKWCEKPQICLNTPDLIDEFCKDMKQPNDNHEA